MGAAHQTDDSYMLARALRSSDIQDVDEFDGQWDS